MSDVGPATTITAATTAAATMGTAATASTASSTTVIPVITAAAAGNTVRFRRSYDIIKDLLQQPLKDGEGILCEVAGHVCRAKQRFVHITDGSTAQPLQLVLTDENRKKCGKLYPGTTVKAKGKLVIPKSGKECRELQTITFEVIGRVSGVDMSLPVLTYMPTKDPHKALKDHVTLETLREHGCKRVMDNRIQSIFRIRAKLSQLTTEFMVLKGVLHLDPNIITGADCEGAGEMFIVTTDDQISSLLSLSSPTKSDQKELKVQTTMDSSTPSSTATPSSTSTAPPFTPSSAPPLQPDWTRDHFSNVEPARLTVSSQLGLEYLVPGMGAVYTTNKSFRAEKSKTQRHLAEFSHVEAELPFITFSDLMDFEEEYVVYCIRGVLRDCYGDLDFLDKSQVAPGVTSKLKGFVCGPFGRITYTDAVQLLEQKKKDVLKTFPEVKSIPTWGEDLGGYCERYLSEMVYKKPIFVTGMPKKLKSFYMAEEPKSVRGQETVQGCDLLIPGLGELIGGSIREFRYEVLVREMLVRGMYKSPSPISKETFQSHDLTEAELDVLIKKHQISFGALHDYVELRKNGATPTGGFGLGFERLVTICTSSMDGGNIRDRTPFPVAYTECHH